MELMYLRHLGNLAEVLLQELLLLISVPTEPLVHIIILIQTKVYFSQTCSVTHGTVLKALLKESCKGAL